MALKSGFFDSLNGDRKYNSVQMSQIFDGIINDGVFQHIGNAFFVRANEGLNITVSEGRAWFNSTWTHNDSDYNLLLDEASVIYPRIDTICLKIDSTLAVRDNSIVVLKGTPGSTPVAPTYVDTDEIHYHPLADIYVGAGVTEIVQANITNRVGTSVTPFVTGILETIDTDELLVQWEAQFSEWFEHIRGQLDEDAAGHLQNEIDDINDLIDGHSIRVMSISEHEQSGASLPDGTICLCYEG